MKKGILRLGIALGIVFFFVCWISFSVLNYASGGHSYIFSGWMILFAFVSTLIFIGILLGIYTMIRWVYLGFREDKK